MSRVEAQRIIQEVTERKPVLSEELAARMRETVGVRLDDSVSLKDLYFSVHTAPDDRAGEEWQKFALSLEQRKKQAITSSLGGLTHDITVGDIRRMDDIKAFSRKRGLYLSTFGLSFFKLAFEREADDS
jgi:hypothetical protein